jgi:steroid 5-alpha reductase family enzyme
VVGFILYNESKTKKNEDLQPHLILLIAICFWGFRLTFNFVNRGNIYIYMYVYYIINNTSCNIGGIGHEDWRYAAMREKIGYSFWFFSLFLVFLGMR